MPTSNPVPSQDPSDLLFNAGKLDEVVNGTANSFTDRLGVARRTVAGMNADFDAQLADAESDLNVYRADAAASAAEALGYLQTIRATSYGAYASDPATDPLGNPPTVGDEYFNTTANLLKRWNGTTWQASDINTANLAASSGSSLVGYDGGTVQDVLDAVTGQNGAASVGYTPAGTGAGATTVQSKLREMVSVKDFGAVGDGVTNDTTKINAVPVFPAIFPAGSYDIASDIAGIGKMFVGFGGVSFSAPYKVRSSVAYGVGALAKNVGFDTTNPSLTDKNVGVGTYSLYNNTTGYHNTAVGDEALFENITGSQNTAVGMNALNKSTGSNNTAIGASALLNTTGINNTAVGRAAGITLGAADFNTLTGRNCGWQKTNGNNDTYYGAEIAWNATISSGDNAALGWRAAYNLTGQYNTAIGNESLYSAVGATNCVTVGRRAAFANTANDLTAVGSQAAVSNTIGARMTSVGARAGYSNVSGADGTFVGWQAGYPMTGNNSTVVGSGAGAGSGNSNTIVGTNAGNGLTTGAQNILIGSGAAQNLQNGNLNVVIGYNKQIPSAGVNNQLVVAAGTTLFQLTDGVQWLAGSGTPEGAVTAPVGSIFTRRDGAANTTLYVKESGTGNTGWIAK